MYRPSHYREDDREKLLAFMREFSFATLVSFDGERSIATHLPFAIKSEENSIRLITHMAKPNQQWKTIQTSEVLVIFQGPHAYISPTNYESKVSVPTWNYIAVHVYGAARLLEENEYDRVLREMIDTYEPAYVEQYESLPDHYRIPNMKGIVCLEIEVTKLEGQFKLSQDKKPEDRERVKKSLANDSSARDLIKHMK